MADIFQNSAAWLAGQFQTHASRKVIYQRGSLSVEVSATAGRTEWELQDGDGFLTRTESRDFLVPVAQLVLGGRAVEPQAADRIVETVAGVAYTYEVMCPDTREPAWRYCDSYRQTYRIHTKEVARG